jgi:predicted NAD/FAD-binding protein
MAAAIWSSAADDVLRFPAATFLRFCINHALLQVNQRPPWRTVAGGSREYVARLIARLDDVRLSTPVRSIRRDDATQGVTVVTDAAGPERFDAVVLASHAPTSLALLADADAEEHATLGAVRYQRNVALLHTDAALLPRRRRVWSAWNYVSRGAHAHGDTQPVCVSYLINQLQPLPFRTPVVVTLNPVDAPAPHTVLGRYVYEHPLLDLAAIDAQQRLPGLQGRRRTWFAGAWTGYGFHENGLKSALRVARDFGATPAWATL